MKKVALIFALAVFMPSLLLAWLAVRSLRDAQVVSERQQTLLYQSVADTRVKEAQDALSGWHNGFVLWTEALLRGHSAGDVANEFDARLRESWPLAEVGFVVSLDGQVLAPSLFAGPAARRFRLENDLFLCNRETVEVYWNTPKGAINLSTLDRKEKLPAKDGGGSLPPAGKDDAAETKAGKTTRTVVPAKDSSTDGGLSKLSAEEADFKQIVADDTDGTLARFLQNKLNVIFWHRPASDPQFVFGSQLKLNRLIEGLKNVIQIGPELQNEICVALLDDTGKPVALSRPGFTPRSQTPAGPDRDSSAGTPFRPGGEPLETLAPGRRPASERSLDSRPDWKHPFVAREIGEALPHWEVAVYLMNPNQVLDSARRLRLTVGSLVALLLFAIGVGGSLIVSDLRRQLTLARQKTDFVSNVSHELKTPLTSIRMFSELLAEGRVQEPGRERHFLKIITAETARLTRLINNVLDFSRLERGEKKYQLQPLDLAAVIRETVEAYRPHLESNGFHLDCALPSAPVWVNGDRDALAQLLVNLISNAEKYGGEPKQIVVRLEANDAGAEIKVLDRGPGVPRGCEEKIFEQFFRADDSLASGIQGSGLGLTLARQIARAHGGDVLYAPREGGGSCFTLHLPRGLPPTA